MASLSRGTLWTGLFVLFLAGALTGAVGTTLYYQYEGKERRWERGPAARQERIMQRLTQELSLSPTQRAEIDPIVNRAHLDILRLRVQYQPDVDRILSLGMGEIKAKISPEQQVKLDLLYAQLQRRWRTNSEYVRQVQDMMGRKE
ncbi:MAG: hypothetical protein OJF47_003772 [Nitrospira sp.]|jgi:hypothetical protein|nr:MAG: hypothetical protein OJF47_003772 [Nitrospira sp.]